MCAQWIKTNPQSRVFMTATSALPSFFWHTYVCVCHVYDYLHVCSYMCVYIHVRECLWRPEVDVGSLPQYTLLIHAGSWLNLDLLPISRYCI